MLVKFVDLSPKKAECYSNAVYHNELSDTYEAAAQTTTGRLASELVRQFYLDSLAERLEAPAKPLAVQKAAGSRLLQIVKERITSAA